MRATLPIERIINLVTAFKIFFEKNSGKIEKVVQTVADNTLKADAKGEGQVDERLTLTSFARAIKRLRDDYGLTTKNATDRIRRMLRVINKHNPEEIRCISLTFGLEQSKVEREIPQGKDKNGKAKTPIKKTSLENKDGQEMAIMLALYDNDEFTKEFCDFAISSIDLFEFKLKKWQKHALSFLKKSDVKIASAINGVSKEMSELLPEISLKHPNGTYRPPLWTDFVPFWMRKKIITKCRQKHLEQLMK